MRKDVFRYAIPSEIFDGQHMVCVIGCASDRLKYTSGVIVVVVVVEGVGYTTATYSL
jgi:hypothetical protein